jgi:pyruvate carboxylase subunit B
MHKYDEVIAAMGEAVHHGGFGTSVTPVSQFYFQQAFNNVMFGPWKKIADGYGRMVLGYFGKTPVPPAPEVIKLASEQLKLEPTGDHLGAIEADTKRGVKAARAALEKEKLPLSDENIFIAASCEEKGIAFLKGQGSIGVRKVTPAEKNTSPAPVAPSAAGTAPTAYQVALNGRNYRVVLDGVHALVNGTSYDVEVAVAAPEAPKPASGTAGEQVGQTITTQLPGVVLRIEKPAGTQVKAGETVLVIESMKMETAIVTNVGGTVAEIRVKQADQVEAGQVLAVIR